MRLPNCLLNRRYIKNLCITTQAVISHRLPKPNSAPNFVTFVTYSRK